MLSTLFCKWVLLINLLGERKRRELSRKMLVKSRVKQPSASVLSRKRTILLCIGCFTSRTLDKTISNLKMELAAARAAQESVLSGSPLSEDLKNTNSSGKRRYFMVVGISTAFSSQRRRDSVRATWMPQGEEERSRKKRRVLLFSSS